MNVGFCVNFARYSGNLYIPSSIILTVNTCGGTEGCKERRNLIRFIFRSFSISIFEIYSERGKGEKVCDLSQEGTELSMQQSTIKGLQEVHSCFCCLSSSFFFFFF